LGSVESLDLGLLVDRDDDRVGRWIHVEANDVLDLGGKGGIVGPLERAQAMGLKVMGASDALNGSQRNPDGLRHRARPVQWVTAPGGSVRVKATIRATTALAIGAVPGLPVLSRSKPSTPSSPKRRCQR
jgi:hypothetical protein